MYNKKHQKIVDNYDKTKSKHLDKLASKMLDLDERNNKLKTKPLKGKFLKNF
tara:strand:- start:482 stop:637 length:156 start_codon:yes stop_codon:yes gene_type:complete